MSTLITQRGTPPASIIPYGECHCGCGQKTRLATNWMRVREGIIRPGEPAIYLPGHRLRRLLSDRFWEKVDKNGPVVRVDLDACWLWTGALDGKGYGLFRSKNKTMRAHRVSFEMAYGYLPENPIHTLHKCDNPPCIRPNHLFAGTQIDNMRDATNKGRFPLGAAVWNCQLTADSVLEIRKLYDERLMSIAKIAALFNTSDTNVWQIGKRLRWKYL